MKNITKEQIIETTLALINEKSGIQSVNFREIARKMNCAHTNLYNYFTDFDDLIWNAVEAALFNLSAYVTVDLGSNENQQIRLESFITRFIDFYLINKGWFKLIWFEKLGKSRPPENIEISHKVVYSLTDTLCQLYPDQLTLQDAHYILHNVHCYLHGEISIFLSGRGLIKEEKPFKNYVKNESLKIIRLLAASLKN